MKYLFALYVCIAWSLGVSNALEWNGKMFDENYKVLTTYPTSDAIKDAVIDYFLYDVQLESDAASCMTVRNMARSSINCIETGFTTDDQIVTSYDAMTTGNIFCIKHLVDFWHKMTYTDHFVIHTVASAGTAGQFNDAFPHRIFDYDWDLKTKETASESTDKCLIVYVGIDLQDDVSLHNRMQNNDPLIAMSVILSNDIDAVYDTLVSKVIDFVPTTSILNVVVNKRVYDIDNPQTLFQVDMEPLEGINRRRFLSGVPLAFVFPEGAESYDFFEYDLTYSTVELISSYEDTLMDFLDNWVSVNEFRFLSMMSHYAEHVSAAAFLNATIISIVGNVMVDFNEPNTHITDLSIEWCKNTTPSDLHNAQALTKLRLMKHCPFYDSDKLVEMDLSSLAALSIEELYLEGNLYLNASIIIEQDLESLTLIGILESPTYSQATCTEFNNKGYVLKGHPTNPYLCRLSGDAPMMPCADTLCVSDIQDSIDYMNDLVGQLNNHSTGNILFAYDSSENTSSLFMNDYLDYHSLESPTETDTMSYMSLLSVSSWIASHAYPVVYDMIYPVLDGVNTFSYDSDFWSGVTEITFAKDIYSLHTSITFDEDESSTSFYTFLQWIAPMIRNLGSLSLCHLDDNPTYMDISTITALDNDDEQITFPTLYSYELDYPTEYIDCTFLDIIFNSPNLLYIDIEAKFVGCPNTTTSDKTQTLQNLSNLQFLKIIGTQDNKVPLQLFMTHVISIDTVFDPLDAKEKIDNAFISFPRVINTDLTHIHLKHVTVGGVPSKEYLLAHQFKFLALIDCELEGAMEPIYTDNLVHLDLSDNPLLQGNVTELLPGIGMGTVYINLFNTGIVGTINSSNFSPCASEYEGVCIVNEFINVDDCPTCEYPV